MNVNMTLSEMKEEKDYLRLRVELLDYMEERHDKSYGMRRKSYERLLDEMIEKGVFNL